MKQKRDEQCLTLWAVDAIPKNAGFTVGSDHRRHGCWSVEVKFEDPLDKTEFQVRHCYWNHFPNSWEVRRAVASMVFGIGVVVGMRKAVSGKDGLREGS